MILAIDPGTTQSGWCVLDGTRLIASGVSPNSEVACMIYGHSVHDLAIEMIASYGMAVGKEVFETCVWIGRFMECYYDPERVLLVYRKDVKIHVCSNAHAKDANVRQALIDMFPATGGGKTPQVGTKGQPGPLYGVSSHVWAALGVAVTAQHVIDKAKPAVPVRVVDPLNC
jgi:hypothetical protein